METQSELQVKCALIKHDYKHLTDLEAEIRAQIISAMIDIFKELDVTRIEVSGDFYDYLGGDYPSITYDGGNHPEYASNAFSQVEVIILNEDGKIKISCEDEDNMDLDRIWSLGELVGIFDTVKAYYDIERGKASAFRRG